MKRISLVIAGVALLATQARGDVDSFGLGNGTTPAPTLVGGDNTVNSYASVTQVNAASVVVSSSSDANAFAPANNGGRNVLAMIWIAKRLAAVADTGSPFSLDPTITGAWELARVSGVGGGSGTTITFQNPLIGSYPAGALPSGDAQIILVPEFASLTIPAGQNVVPKAWDGSSGGVVAMLVQGTLNVDGSINADAKGFKGGAHGGAFTNQPPSPPPQCGNGAEGLSDGSAGTRGENCSSSQGTGRKYLANGAGGGLCVDNGGGGGGNGGKGGDGDSSNGTIATGIGLPGHGGAELDYSPITHFTFGGGGGSGQIDSLTLDPGEANGAGGAGAVFVRAGTVTGGGSITANGASAAIGGHPVGQGGGGGGGTIYLRVAGSTSICGSIQVKGGAGGSGPAAGGRGGGGAGGHVFVQALPACSGTDVSGGAKGGGGADPGANGQEHVPPNVPLGPYCTSDGDCSGVIGRPACNSAPSTNACVQCTGTNKTACTPALPVCAANACATGCTVPADCNAFPTSPICNTPGPGGTCGPCLNSGQCPLSNPVCDTLSDPLQGACVQCSDDADCLSAANPICNVGTHVCGPCTGTGDDPVCLAHHSATPVCGLGGACVQCRDNSTCTGSTPTCNTGNNTCEGCDQVSANTGCTAGLICHRPGDVGSAIVGSCVACSGSNAANANATCTADPDKPTCSGTNTCVVCSNDTSCNGHASLPRCQIGTGACVQCLATTDCSNPHPICTANACVGCGGNGECEAKDSTTPLCSTGSCLGCGGSDANCTVSATRPACQADGSCKQCSGSNLSQCGTTAPVCTSGACGACNAQAQCARFASAPNCETAIAVATGHCVQCRSDNASADCAANAAPLCTSNACGSCAIDANAGETACHTALHGNRHCEASGTPASLNGQCVICRGELDFATTDCSSALPLCNPADDTCGKCSADGTTQCVKFGAAFVCDNPADTSDAGVQGTGACVGCVTDNDCHETTNPHCVAKSCVGCDSTLPAHGDESCAHFTPDAGVPACQPGDGIASSPGECRQCSFSNGSQCTGSTPSCNFVTGSCQLCTVENGDLGAQSIGCTSDTNGHACQGSGTSVFCGCTSDADCGSNTSGRICDGISHLCQDGCSRSPTRNNCPSGKFCSSDDVTGTETGVCTVECQFDVDCTATPALPFCINVSHSDAGADAGTMGRCAGCRSDADCGGSTPVCEPTTKICVQCTTTSLATCSAANTGAICLMNETCGCAADSDCGAADSGRICDLVTTHRCTPGCRVLGGNGCPAGLICNGAGLVPGACVAFVDMAVNIPDASEQDLSVPLDLAQNNNFRLTGGGVGCSVSFGGGMGGAAEVGALLLLSLAALLLRRRRRS